MSSITRRFSAVLAKSTASGTPILLISGLPLSCSCTSTRMNPEETQVGRCATAQPLHFVLFDGERDLAGSGITADQANLAACHVIEHCRKVARRGAWMTGADDQLACQQILERFQRRVGASNADIMIDGRRAEMPEFRRVVPEPLRIAEQRVKQRIEHGAVLQR